MTQPTTTTRPAFRLRLSAGLGLGLGATLLLSACGNAGGEASETAAEPSAPPQTVTETASPSATPTTSATATGTPSASPSASGTGEPPAGATQTYTTESGAFTWTFPDTWTASQEEYSEDSLDYVGEPYEVVLFQDPDLAVEYRTTTGVGPTDNDGPKPDVVAVLDTEELPDVPVSEGADAFGTGPVWYRASLLQATDEVGDLESFEGGQFLLSVQVVNVAEDIDPEDPGESFWSSWFYEQPPAEGHQYGAAAFLSGSVTQDAAEETTGLEGEEAIRAFLETEEYAQLRSVATSMEVSTP